MQQWRVCVETTPKPYTSATLYGGRSFKDATWSALTSDLPHFVVSAGLGLVGPDEKIPAYALTTAGPTDENVLTKCPIGTLPADWWRTAFPDNVLAESIEKANGRIFVALPSVYLEMIHDNLLALTTSSRGKVRILTGAGQKLRGSRLSEYILPYDARLDGPDSPLPGTKSDFANRALRHFITLVGDLPVKDFPEDRVLVERSLASMKFPILPKRERKPDSVIKELLIASWALLKGNRQQLLRHLRDRLLISCEQSRFTRIAREIEEDGLL